MTSEPISEPLSSLGAPLHVYPAKAGAGRAGYLAIGAVLALIAGFAVIGLVNPPAHNPPPPIIYLVLTGVFGMLSLTFFGYGLFCVQSYTLILFPDGLARTGGSKPEIFRWSDVSEVYTVFNPIAGKHRLVAQDGRKLEIADASVKDGKVLGQTVQETLYKRMLPEAVKAFEHGDTLAFGPLRLNQGFLTFKDKRLAWSEIDRMQLLYNTYTRSQQFEVRAAASAFLPWCVVKAQDIPNIDIFKKLAERKQAFA
jgi:hypothetical protein